MFARSRPALKNVKDNLPQNKENDMYGPLTPFIGVA